MALVKAFIVAKLTYTTHAWWGLATAATDSAWKQLSDALCSVKQISLAELVQQTEVLFHYIQCNNTHLLNRLLPSKTDNLQS